MPIPLFALTIGMTGWNALDGVMDETNKKYNNELRKRMRRAIKLLAKETRSEIRSGTITQTGNLLRRGVRWRILRGRTELTSFEVTGIRVRGARGRFNQARIIGGAVGSELFAVVFYGGRGFYGRFLELGFKHVGGGFVAARLFMVAAVARKGGEAERIVGDSIKAVAF